MRRRDRHNLFKIIGYITGIFFNLLNYYIRTLILEQVKFNMEMIKT